MNDNYDGSRWMRIAVLGIISAFIIGAAGILAGCGAQDDEKALIEDASRDASSGEWFTETDPQTGRTFRCVLFTRAYRGAGLGAASHCYELEVAG